MRQYGWYAINVDGNFLEDTPVNLYQRGEVKHVPIMAGINSEEGTGTVIEIAYTDYYGSLEPPFVNRQSFEDVVESKILRTHYFLFNR